MKRFVIEMDDDTWEEICTRQKPTYRNMEFPPLDNEVFYDYLARRTSADHHDDDEMHHIRISEIP